MVEPIISLSKVLVAIPTIVGDTKYMDLALEITHQDLYDYNFTKYVSNDVQSLLYYNTKDAESPFKVILNCNIDVVPGKNYQFKPYVKEGKLYGRGSFDMKAATAAMILLFKDIAKQVEYPLALQITSDQEIGGHHGTKYQIEQGVRGTFAITCSTTNLDISNESKGEIRMKVFAKGTAGTSAYLWQAKNAILEIKQFLDRLEKEYPVLQEEVWKTTVNVAKIATTNTSFNSVPDDCEVWLDIKYTREEQDTILDKIKSIIPEGYTMEIVQNEPPLFTSKDNEYITSFSKAFEKTTGKQPNIVKRNYTVESRFYSAIGSYGMSFGPIGGGAHTDEEWVDIESLEHYYNTLKTFLLSIK